MKIDILTLFPEMFVGPMRASILGKAQEKNIIEIQTHNIRDYTTDKHRIVDDYPFGGGAGMVMKPEPIFNAIEHLQKIRGKIPRLVLMCPQGKVFNQQMAEELAREQHLVFLCGHYEGIDERVRQHLVTDEISIGDFVLTGGELPAMVVIDALARFVPGVLGEAESVAEESFQGGLLEYPQYTRPREFMGLKVPDVLLSGDHAKIKLWRRQQALQRTMARRPDLININSLTVEDKKILDKEIKVESYQIKQK